MFCFSNCVCVCARASAATSIFIRRVLFLPAPISQAYLMINKSEVLDGQKQRISTLAAAETGVRLQVTPHEYELFSDGRPRVLMCKTIHL